MSFQSFQMESLRITRNWIFRLIKLLQKSPQIGYCYTSRNSVPQTQTIMDTLRNHLELIGQLDDEPKNIIQNMIIHRLTTTGFHKTNVRLMDRFEDVLNGKYGVMNGVTSLNETLLYYILTVLDFEDVLNAISNWELIGQFKSGNVIVTTIVSDQLKNNRWKLNLETYMDLLVQYIDTTKCSYNKHMLESIMNVCIILTTRFEFNEAFRCLPSKDVFPGGIEYQNAYHEFQIYSQSIPH